MTDLMENIDQETFDAGVNKVLTAVKFAYASREEKLKMVFDHIDADGSGELDRQRAPSTRTTTFYAAFNSSDNDAVHHK